MNTLPDLAKFFNALSDETRLRLVVLLTRQEPGHTLCVGRLAQELETSISNVSQHLRVLKDLELVQGERRHRRIHYTLNANRLTFYRELGQRLLGTDMLTGIHTSKEASTMCHDEKQGCDHQGKKQAEKDCSPEQTRECHGEGEGRSRDCTPERVQECHGDVQEHPCESRA